MPTCSSCEAARPAGWEFCEDCLQRLRTQAACEEIKAAAAERQLAELESVLPEVRAALEAAEQFTARGAGSWRIRVREQVRAALEKLR